MATSSPAGISKPGRFTNAYGGNTIKRTSTGRWINHLTGWNDPQSDSYFLDNFRSTPVKGTMTSSGFRKPTSWRFHAHDLSPGTHDYRFLENGYQYSTSGPWPVGAGLCTLRRQTPPTGVVVLPAWLVADAETQMRNNVGQSNLDLGASLGELDEALASLAELATRLAKGISRIRKGDVYGAIKEMTGIGIIPSGRGYRWTRSIFTGRPKQKWRKVGGLDFSGVPQATAAAYLAAQYGFKPLLSDIHAVMQGITSRGKRGWLFSATGQAVQQLSPYTAVNGAKPTTSVTGRALKLARCRCWFTVDQPAMMQLDALGLVNPLALGWELLTLSFVIDWFIPIGAFLKSLTALTGTTFVAGLLDKIDHYDVTVWDNRGTFIKGTRASCRSRFLTFERQTYGAAPFPNPFVLLSGLGLNNVPRALSAAALVTQASRL